MKLAPMKELLLQAQKKGIAYGAYVAVSYDTALAAIEAGSELNVPVLLIMGTDCVDLLGGFETTVQVIRAAAKDSTVPVVLHLDHSRSYEDCCKAVNAGFSSVMIDGSALPLEENIRLTRRVVEFARPLGVTVEGELGRLIGEEGDLIVHSPDAAQTDPEQARYFVEQTGVDCLAVSIGTQHGAYRQAPRLNIERLKKIREAVNLPLVLHGGSGTPIDQVRSAIENGIAKINIATEVLTAYVQSFDQQRADNPEFKYNTQMYAKAKDACKRVVLEKMRAFSLKN